jgi:predicted transposase YbfD/YdcC
MSKPQVAHLIDHFSKVPDPRLDRRKKHLLSDILVIAICGAICGADNWVTIEAFGQARYDWFKTFLRLPNGIPSHDTFGRVFALLSPAYFQEAFSQWIKAVVQQFEGQVVAIDGKRARRSYDTASGKGALYMVNAWATKNRVVLGQYNTEEGSNEITAIPELLRALVLKGCIVTIDAIGCHKEIAEQIVDQGADYVLTVKANQKKLLAYAQQRFSGTDKALSKDPTIDSWLTRDQDHGRIETRQYWATDHIEDLPGKASWKGLQCIGTVEARRQVGFKVSCQRRYFISSLDGDALRLAEAVRAHWSIENSLHWVLDVVFHEDDSRIRKGNAAENMAVLRQIAVSLLRQEKTAKVGVQTKRLKAGWDTSYLAKVLSAGKF